MPGSFRGLFTTLSQDITKLHSCTYKTIVKYKRLFPQIEFFICAGGGVKLAFEEQAKIAIDNDVIKFDRG